MSVGKSKRRRTAVGGGIHLRSAREECNKSAVHMAWQQQKRSRHVATKRTVDGPGKLQRGRDTGL